MKRSTKIAILLPAACLLIGGGAFFLHPKSALPPRPMADITTPSTALSRSPLELSSATLSGDGREVLLEFQPDVMPFDPADLELKIQFWENGPAGRVQAGLSPAIDWSMWSIPVLGKKPRRLRLSPVGAFHEMTVEIRHKSVLVETRSYLRK